MYKCLRKHQLQQLLLRQHSLLPYFSHLLDLSLSSKSLKLAQSTHSHMIKLGLLYTHTFLGNRLVDLYSKCGNIKAAVRVFDDIEHKNVISWNICLKVFVKSCDICSARKVFDEMPERDVVSWNSMILCYVSSGFFGFGLELLGGMLSCGVRPSGFTFSILVSYVTCGRLGKEFHGNMVRNGVDLGNVVVGNSLIDMYGKLGLMGYAFGVFLVMEEVDVISWNSLFSGCCKSGYEELALRKFGMMMESFSPDEFTMSAVITACSNLQDLEKGEQMLTVCVKLGFLSNTIVSSAVIDLFSKCKRVEESLCVFKGINVWDSVVCNSMISCYAKNGFEENALQLFILTLRKDIRPTEFTVSCVVSCASAFLPMLQGLQIHCSVVKFGYESDSVVASSLVEMYSNYGSINCAMLIFSNMVVRDLICWNTIILGLVNNGEVVESLNLFLELLQRDLRPDHITMAGVLLACSYGGLVDEGIALFEAMEKEYGIKPVYNHYACVVEMMSGVGKFKEALKILSSMPYEAKPVLLESILEASELYGDFRVVESVAKRLIDLQPRSSLPYLALAKAYERSCRWESLVRVRKIIEQICSKEETFGCSWIGIRNRVYLFKENQLVHHCGKAIYPILRLLTLDMVNTEITDTRYE